MTRSLLATKLYAPHLHRQLILRPSLLQRLDSGLRQGSALTLVSAPAGFGKTTLVITWLQHLQEIAGEPAPRPYGWLSLDENDNDPPRFLAYLLAALQTIDPRIGQTVLPMLQTPQPPPSDQLLTALVNDISTADHPFCLVLDDYHVIRTMPIHQLLAFLLQYLPPQAHLIIATREDPPLPLSRLRARGRMTEIRQADLCFNTEETASFMQQAIQLELLPADVTALQQRTEGWVAGLQLAAVALKAWIAERQLGQGPSPGLPLASNQAVPSAQTYQIVSSFVQAFSGSHHHILDYLMEEVFQSQPAGIQHFLLRTAILDRLSPDLCDAVCFGVTDQPTAPGETSGQFDKAEASTGLKSSQEILQALDQANLFLIPLDASRQWYRYHHLFGDLLRYRLKLSGEPIAPLHRRASRWYAENGFAAEAIQHALSATDWDQAAKLLQQNGQVMLTRGEIRTLIGWFQALPKELLLSRPELGRDYGWALVLAGQLDPAEFFLRHTEPLVQDDPALLADVLSAQAFIARARGDRAQTIELAERAMALFPEDHFMGRSITGVILGIAHWERGQLDAAEQVFTATAHAGQQSGNAHAHLTAVCFLGRVLSARGRLRQGAKQCHEVIALSGKMPGVSLAYHYLGVLSYEWNDLEAAERLMEQAIVLSRRGGNTEAEITSLLVLAFVHQVRGRADAVQDTLLKTQQLLQNKDIPPHTRSRCAAMRARLALLQGDLPAAEHWTEQVSEPAGSHSFYPFLALAPARLLLAQGNKAAAAAELAHWHETAQAADWQYGLLEILLLQAMAAVTSAEAMEFLQQALALAQPEDYVRSFVDKGPAMANLLRQVDAQDGLSEYVAQLLAAFDSPAAEPTRPSAEAAPQPTLPTEALPEPLSEREVEVLQLLAQGQTYQEIAQALFVSLNTVKTHLKNIYGKLGVSNRRKATTRAQELGLVRSNVGTSPSRARK